MIPNLIQTVAMSIGVTPHHSDDLPNESVPENRAEQRASSQLQEEFKEEYRGVSSN